MPLRAAGGLPRQYGLSLGTVPERFGGAAQARHRGERAVGLLGLIVALAGARGGAALVAAVATGAAAAGGASTDGSAGITTADVTGVVPAAATRPCHHGMRPCITPSTPAAIAATSKAAAIARPRVLVRRVAVRGASAAPAFATHAAGGVVSPMPRTVRSLAGAAGPIARWMASSAASSTSTSFTPIPAGLPGDALVRVHVTRPSAGHAGPPRLNRISSASRVPRGNGATAGMKSPPAPRSTMSASRGSWRALS